VSDSDVVGPRRTTQERIVNLEEEEREERE
jgi:hypothetical protein